MNSAFAPPETDITTLDAQGARDHLARHLHSSLRRQLRMTEEHGERIQRIGELNSRMIFLTAAGHIPVQIQKHVQAVLMPVDEAQEPIRKPLPEKEKGAVNGD